MHLRKVGWTGLIWLRIRTGGRKRGNEQPESTKCWEFLFRLAENRLASQEGLCCMEWVSKAAENVKPTSHLHIMARLRISGAIPSFSHMATRRAQGQIFYFMDSLRLNAVQWKNGYRRGIGRDLKRSGRELFWYRHAWFARGKGKSKTIPLLDRPWGFQEVEAPKFQDNRHMKVVRLSALRTGRIYPPGNIPGTHFC